MNVIRNLEHYVSDLALPGLPPTTVAEHAALQIIDKQTLAVVPLGNHFTHSIEQALTTQELGVKLVTITGSVITIQI